MGAPKKEKKILFLFLSDGLTAGNIRRCTLPVMLCEPPPRRRSRDGQTILTFSFLCVVKNVVVVLCRERRERESCPLGGWW
jgi:hypothetical protein